MMLTSILKSIWKGAEPVTPDLTAHIPGVHEGNSVGNYEKQPGHLRDGRSTAERSTGINPRPHNPILPQMPNLSPP
jgi:hypothetical protein